MAWKSSLGNLITRAPGFAVAGGDSEEDPLYPLSDIGNGYPDDPSRFLLDTDGEYQADFDLNLLAMSSLRTDAPSGWRNLSLALAGTPGLGANPPEWGTFESRADTLKIYGPVFQDIEVMPGEDLNAVFGSFIPTASDATSIEVRVLRLSDGKQWDRTMAAWNNSTTGVGSQAVLDTWADFDEPITNTSTERETYRVIATPLPGPFGATTYAYINDPALTAAQDFLLLIGHNIPFGSTVEWDDGGTPAAVTLAQPTAFATFATSSARNWSLTITQPANTLAWHAAPFIGEVWAGRLVDMVACPGYPFDIVEGDIAQVRLEGGLGRETVFTEIERPSRMFKIRFKTTNDSQYEDARDGFLRASRWGADPLILCPVGSLEGSNTFWHGRVGPDTTFARTSLSKRTFEVSLRESPFPRFR
jgi:hypothetical protein